MKVLLTSANILPNSQLLEQHNIKIQTSNENNPYMLIIPDDYTIINSSNYIQGINGQLLLNTNNEPIINLHLTSVDPMRHPEAEYDYVNHGNVVIYPIKLPSVEKVQTLKTKYEDEYFELIEIMRKSYELNTIKGQLESNEEKNFKTNSNEDVEYNDINVDYVPEDLINNKKI